MSDLVIQIKDLSKSYKIYSKPIDRLKESVHPLSKKFHKEFHALKNISFELVKGETVGVVGTNGSGKSTLLKLITGVLHPTAGEVSVYGKVAAILELGAGFNPEFTGIENIYLNGTIMGYSKKEIEDKLDSIISFAEIGEFINQPVKTYSSGMFARLAFAVAINVEPDVLIVDEALSVGDTRFQMKCIEKMKQIKESGTTILFVSHATEQIKRFCTKAIWIEKGHIKAIGDANEIVNLYEDSMHLEILNQTLHKQQEQMLQEEENLSEKPSTDSSKVGIINSVVCVENELSTFESLIVQVKYTILQKVIPNFLLGVAIYDRDRKYIFGPNTYLDKIEGVPNTYGAHSIQYIIPKLPLLSGTYFIDVGIFSDEGLICIDYQTNSQTITLKNEYFTEGLVYLEHEWRVIK
ncbi:teichoic acid ABC transporter ATP-binding protein [Paenibacillus tyrfis]|uniref:ABC transporter ATP-binding protein n=1 Tax=Paenibacillus tyrfis TaxID=1501230 RepID=UPI002493A371|nr:ABC transporter ATP-binding protein [Paenibacillus tyrfis]GLI09878.1 teichoic acid ABC transporter ATP-binding protein [Paenibacillus tyrfis]